MNPRRSDPYAIQQQLRLAARDGTRATMLLAYHRPLIDLLIPEDDQLEGDAAERLALRAIQAEQLVRTALGRIGGQRAKALEILLDLQGEGLPLEERRHAAAQTLKIATVTFRRSPRRERLLLLELSVELYRLSIARQC